MNKQMEMFDEHLEKKILRLEKWIYRLQKEMWFLKEVWNLSDKGRAAKKEAKVEQLKMFG